VPGRDEQQNGNEDPVRGKEERYFAVGETECPCDLCRHIVAGTAGHDAKHCAKGGPCALLVPSAGWELQFANACGLVHCPNHTRWVLSVAIRDPISSYSFSTDSLSR